MTGRRTALAGLTLGERRGPSVWQPVDTSLGLVQQAWHWMDEAQVGFWDSLILAAAERAGCVWLVSEDFQDGRKLGSLTVVDPFRVTPAQLGLESSQP